MIAVQATEGRQPCRTEPVTSVWATVLGFTNKQPPKRYSNKVQTHEGLSQFLEVHYIWERGEMGLKASRSDANTDEFLSDCEDQTDVHSVLHK